MLVMDCLAIPVPPLPAAVDADAWEDAGEVGVGVVNGAIARRRSSVAIGEIEDRCRIERLREICVTFGEHKKWRW